MIRNAVLGLALSVLPVALASGQSRAAVALERNEFQQWMGNSPISPHQAVAVHPIGAGLRIGPASADVPLTGVAASRLVQDGGRIRLVSGSVSQPLARGRPLALGQWQLLVTGPSGRATVTVFTGQTRRGKPPEWFSYDSTLRFTVTLVASRRSEPVRLLAPDGVEVEASEAGTVGVPIDGAAHSLRVFRMPGLADEESELEIYFRDATSGRGTYPAGRFVSLIPAGGDRYLLDFNRARNPFCAYNTVYPCPAPWRGNALAGPVRAGERYRGEP